MRKAVIIVGMIAAVLACSESKNDRYIVTEPMYTVSVEIPDSISLGQQIHYTARATLLNSCEHFSQLVQTTGGTDIYITINKYRDVRHQICLTVATPIFAESTFTPSATGIYTFYFWRPEGDYLRREVVVR